MNVDRQYILQDREGDYVESVESTGMDTVKLHYNFTKDRQRAKIFGFNDLWSPLDTTSVGITFTCGFSGSRAIRLHASA